MLTAAIGRLFAVAEAYPQLRATENFQQLQAQLAEAEQNIAVSRQVYNDTVLSYDNALETVPTNIVAGSSTSARASTSRRKAPRGRRRPCSSPTEPARAQPSSPLAAAALLWPRGRLRAKSYSLPARGRRGADPAGRLAPRARAHHVRLLGRRSPARTGTSRCARASRSTTSPSRERDERLPPGRRAPSSAASAARHVRRRAELDSACGSSGTTAAERRAAHVHDLVPLPRARGRLRRRRRREPPGLGRRVARRARRPARRRWSCRGRAALGAALPRLGQPGVGAAASSRARPATATLRAVQRPGAPVRRDARRLPAQRCSRRPRARRFVAGNGCASIVAEEPARAATPTTHDRERDRRREGPPRPHAARPCCCSASGRRSA